MSNNTKQAALGLLDCWTRLDLEDALSRITDDAVFKPDCKADTVAGKEAIRVVWSQYMQVIKTYEYDVKAIASEGGTVFVERDERLNMGEKDLFLPIVAVFEVDQNGKITAWRDYFDTSMVNG